MRYRDLTYRLLKYRPQQKTEKQAATFLLLTLTASSIFGAFVIRPTLATAFKLRKEIQDGRRADVELGQKIRALNEAQKNLTAIEEHIPLVEASLPSQRREDQVLEMLSFLASRNQVTLTKVSFVDGGGLEEPTALPPRTGGLNFTVHLEGNYPNAVNFFGDLERELRIIETQSLQIQEIRLWQHFEQAAVEISFSGRAFFYIEEDAVRPTAEEAGANKDGFF